MGASFLHGVETIEINKGPRPVRAVRSAVIALVGIAPKGPQQELTLVQSDTQAAKFGLQIPGFTIPQALNAINAQGAGTVMVVNVFDSAKHLVEEAAEAQTVANRKFKLDFAAIADLVITDGAATDPVTFVEGTDYEIDEFGNGTVLNSTSIPNGSDIEATYKRLDASLVEAADIIGAIDATTEARTGFKVLALAANSLGFTPRLLISPGFSSLDAVTTEMISQAETFRGHALIDAPAGTTVADAIAGRGPDGTINFDTSNKRAVLCYPHLKAFDPATSGEVDQPFSQFLAGVIADTDRRFGYWFSPSNKEIQGITGVERNLTASINDPNTDVNRLNEAGILSVFNSFGTGLRTWGNRSAAFPSSTDPTQFINVQRTADIIHESVEQAMLQFIDSPITDALIDAITETVNSFLRTLQGRGAIIEGSCSYDPDKNSAEQLANGHITFDITFMPPTPAERITFDSFIDISLLEQLGA